MKFLVIGGSGFIGTYLVADLLGKGQDVVIYDIQISKKYPELCIVGDIRDREKLAESMAGVDMVYHLAAEHRDDVSPVSLYYDVNVGGAENLVYAVEKESVKKMVFTSTVAIYGLNSGIPDENSSIEPFNDYGRSKHNAEQVFKRWADADKSRNLVIVRPTAIFGENNRGNIYNLIKQIASKRFVFVGNGKNKKSMGYVLNFSNFLISLQQTKPGKYIYNYADKPDLSTEELVRITLEALGRPRGINYRIPYPIGLIGGYAFDFLSKIAGKNYSISSVRIKKFCADTRISTSKLRKLGFVHPYPLEEGLYHMNNNDFSKYL
jgi:nucleoside-diphosphate-sugar epimerase